ncbi:MAG: flagellar biosynthesis protein FlhA, partial [Comamonadaceae bacterium]
MNAVQNLLRRNADVAMVLAVLGVLMVLFVPIPKPLLDFLILANFAFAFLVLLLTFYMARPVEFSTFPSLLLVATLFRLSLNVAATRLILAEGDAGKVIGAIGSYVVAGNYVVGLIVFLILIVVQYVVVTNGAQRVSEVAARFTLDSMPGQQMSIDADLNMGFIDQAEAQRRRKNLEKEAGFYGAMDGASKFVKGDAIAGIIILLINIVGGLVIGIMQHRMPWAQALQTYTLLTIGDGIVTQVPALVIAVGTGIIVTRSASDGNLSQEALRQVTSFPKTLLLVAGALGGLLLLPGIPALPTAALMALTLGVAWTVYRMHASSARAAGVHAVDRPC